MVRSLQGRSVAPGTREFGEAFETYLMHELVCRRDYLGGDQLAFWRSTSQLLCVSLEPRTRRVGNITILPYREFLKALWAGEYR